MQSNPPNLPSSPDAINAAYLEPLLNGYLGESNQKLAGFSVQRIDKGTSGAQLHEVAVAPASSSAPLKFILNLGGGRKEVFFYRDLAPRIPIETPRVLDARLLDDGRAWLLMEEITGVKDGLLWNKADYRAVLSDMARLHARYWAHTDLLDSYDWLWRPEAGSLSELVAARRHDLDTISSSWVPEALPEVFGPERLALAAQVLEQPNKVFEPLLSAGTTLVQGDYWFHNVQVTHNGRRVLLDWQDPQIWSGLWELVYFLNLLLAVGPGEFRETLPFDEDLMTGWYRDALAETGVRLPDGVWDKALLAARVWHPIQHWIRQYGQALAQGLLPASNLQEDNSGAVRFLSDTFARWDQDARTLLRIRD